MPTTVLHHLDEPTRWDSGHPILIVRGWCFDPSGDTLVAIEAITAAETISAPVGLSRPDVGAAFENKPGTATSGFCFWLRNRAPSIGTILLRAVHRDGTRTDLRTIQPGSSPTTPSV